MILCYLSKQKTHLRSILTLGDSRDSGIIARAMLESMCQLLWAATDPDNLALRWRSYSWILDLRKMKSRIAAGELVDKQRCNEIERAVQEYGHLHLMSKSEKKFDPYHKDWTGRTFRDLTTDVGAEQLYSTVYRSFSDWQHSSPAGMASALKRSNSSVTFVTKSHSVAATALAVGFQALIQSLEVANNHLLLCADARIVTLRNEYIDWAPIR